MHPNTHSRRRTDRRYTSPSRPTLHLFRAVLGMGRTAEPVPGLSGWRHAAQPQTSQRQE